MRVKLDVGATIDTLTRDELREELQKYRAEGDALAQAYARGIKYFRLPRLIATPASGTVVLGEAWSALGTGQPYGGQVMGPSEGYIWSVRRLACNGLGTGSTPDELNIYRNGHSGDPVWQLNGNNFAYTFGKTEMILLSGEKLVAMSLGSMTATGQVTLTGDAIEVPAEMIGKLVQ